MGVGGGGGGREAAEGPRATGRSNFAIVAKFPLLLVSICTFKKTPKKMDLGKLK